MLKKFLLFGVALSFLFSCAGYRESAEGDTVKVTFLETTDIHVTLMNYDYYQDKEDDSIGLAQTATLIEEAQAEYANTFLVDNGDLIQGTPMGDLVARVEPLAAGKTHPVYKAMNLLSYDVGNIGNHEFNYGLDYLDQVLATANFPYVNSNVYHDDGDDDPDNDVPYFTPYQLIDKIYSTTGGEQVKITIGVLGFCPPQIMVWDKKLLDGQVIAKDIVESAEKYVPVLKENGADIIIAIPHSGLGRPDSEYLYGAENATEKLSLVEGIDAIFFGHSHNYFPSENYTDYPGADVVNGTVNGTPAVMPGRWGDNLGLIEMTLQYQAGNGWQVIDSRSALRPIYDRTEKKALTTTSPRVVGALAEDHRNTLEYVRTAVAEFSTRVHSFFAVTQDDPSVQIVSNAQKWYLENYFEGTEYQDVPILSAAAPFRYGGYYSTDNYTDVPAGTVAIKNVADLYVFPNTLVAVMITGADVKEWLERSAAIFNTINPAAGDGQQLLNNSPAYNFDVIDGVTYQINVSRQPRYSTSGALINPNSNRIENLQYNGVPIDMAQEFIVGTNNYRAYGGGSFPGMDGSAVILASPDETRQVIINYLIDRKTVDPTADNNWRLASLGGIAVELPSSAKAGEVLDIYPKYSFLKENEAGFSIYQMIME